MFSEKTLALVDFALGAGFEEDRVLKLFDQYLAIYVEGDLDVLETQMELHGPQFFEFLQQDFEASTSATPSSVKLKKPFKGTETVSFTQTSTDGSCVVAEKTSLEGFCDAGGVSFVGTVDAQCLSETDEEDGHVQDGLFEEHVRSMQENAMMPMTWEEREMDDLSFALWKIFGIGSFRQSQQEIVLSILAGHDTFVLMPTGGGKSLCYQLPAVISQGLTVVVSPLLSLVQDQVKTLVTLPCGGVPATYLSSTQTMGEKRAVYAEISKEVMTCKLLYVTPEQLTCNQGLIEILRRQQQAQNFQRMVIDEAHCVSMWGHDFRPAYADLGRAKTTLFPGIQTVALTATANEKVKKDVLKSLGMESTLKEFQMSFYRSNLKFVVVQMKSFHQKLVMLKNYIRMQKRGVSGIVYCLSKKECEEVAEFLNSVGVCSAHYHAGMCTGDRESVQNSWKLGDVHVVVATIAFGMGIDNAHVRYVVHFVMPKSMENYYQEAGRAGRDGLRSECILFYTGRDVGRLKLLIRRGQEDYQKGYELVEHVKSYCVNEMDCRHRLILEYLDERMNPPSCVSNCHVCCQKNGGRPLYEQCPWSVVSEDEVASAKTQIQKMQQTSTQEYPY